LIKNIKTLLLAGGKTKHALKKITGQEYKALMNKIDSQPIIYHIVKILRNTKYIAKIYVAGPEEVNNYICPQVDEPYILIITSDIPLVLSRHVENFIKKCLANPGFDLYYSIIKKEIYTQSFPDPNLRRIYANLVEGSYTGGNIFLINPQVIIDFANRIEQFIHFRKHPLKMARILGKRIVIKYLKRYLSIKDLEKMVPDYLNGYTGKAILADPEIALDIDKPIHLEGVRKIQKG